MKKVSTAVLLCLVGLCTIGLFCVYRNIGLQRLSPGELRIGDLATVVSGPANPPEVDDIYEAIVRFNLQKHDFDGVVLLRIDGNDPTSEFMARFKGDDRIKIASALLGTLQRAERIIDTQDGQPIFLISVYNFDWSSPFSAAASGSLSCGHRSGDRVVWSRFDGTLHCSGLDSEYGVYEVCKRNHHWSVSAYHKLIRDRFSSLFRTAPVAAPAPTKAGCADS